MAKIIKNFDSDDNSVAVMGVREIFSYGYVPNQFPSIATAKKYWFILVKQQFISPTNRRKANKLVRFIN